MIERLKILIDECENRPKLKDILLKIASAPEKSQEKMLDGILFILKNGVSKK